MRTPNMLKRLVVLGVCVLPISWQASIVRAQEIGYVEDFALAKDRSEALKSLIPGTDDFYYYHSLHYQHTEQFPKVEELIPQWVQKHGHNQRVNEILTRQALLLYPKDPQRALNRIRERLGVQWPHQKEVVGAKPNLPTGLDQNLFSRESFAAGAFSRHGNLDGFEDSALDWLVTRPLNKDQRRHLLSRLHRPDYPQVVDLILADMKEEGAPGFGAFAIHNLLLPEQLDALQKARPELANNHNFVNARLIKLQPPAHVDWKNDRAERDKYLTRLWDYVSGLAPVFNSLKAHVLYQRLVFDRAGGTFDRDRFMTYIQLPRRTGYANPQYLQKAEQEGRAADLNANYGGFTALGNVGNDEPLVRAYLQQFFLKDADAKAYEPFLHDAYLRRQFAETKIVNGLGNAEQWSAMLSPEEFKQLQERIDLDFAPTNREVLGVDEPVSIDLAVKNVKTLIVKVFELNTTNYYRSNLSELDTDINLDGLVANVEKTETYNEPPLRRVSRHFDFPQLSKAGVYVIDFIGNGQSSRVLVRKGKLRHLVRTSTAGHVFTVLDDQNRHLPDAKLWLAGHEYLADKEGRITVPFSATPGRVPLVLTHGDFSSLDHFAHESENYALTAGFHVDRESLLKLQKATVMIRPSLAINGTPVSLKILEDVRLQITSTDHDGVVATKEVRDFVLLPDREASYEFQVPPRAQSIAFTLQAKVQNLSTGQKLDVVANRVFALNEIDRTDKTEDVYLGVADGAYFLDVYGRTGEALPERAIRVQLKHRDIRQPLTVMLKSNPAGRVSLGKLGAEIDWVEAASPQGVTHRWTLPRDQHTQYASVHGQVGKTIEVPVTFLTAAREVRVARFSPRPGIPGRGVGGEGQFAPVILHTEPELQTNFAFGLRPEGASEVSLGPATNGSAALGTAIDQSRALKGQRNAGNDSRAPSGHDLVTQQTQGGAPYGRWPWADIRGPFGAKTNALDVNGGGGGDAGGNGAVAPHPRPLSPEYRGEGRSVVDRFDGTALRPEGASEVSLGQATNGSAALGTAIDPSRALKGHRNAGGGGDAGGNGALAPHPRPLSPEYRGEGRLNAKTVVFDSSSVADEFLLPTDSERPADKDKGPTMPVSLFQSMGLSESVGGLAFAQQQAAPQAPSRSEVSLLERRGPSFVADRFEAIKLDGGILKLEGLAAGEYDLWLKQTNQHINVRVLDGEAREGYVLGKTRHLEIRDEQPLQIASVMSDLKSVNLKLQNVSPLARVHVIASRYLPTYAPFEALSVVRDAEPYLLTKPAIETKYISGRNIGDEYRYIIDRKYQPKFSGNTATRPSLLLNPWAIRETQTGRQEAAAGDDFGAAGKPQDAMAKRDAAQNQQGGQGAGAQFSNVDFLGAQSAVLLNLVPEKDGTLTIPREKLGPHSYVEIIAVDAQQTASRVLTLSEPEATFRDLRLASSLDVEKHFTEQKQVSVVKAGEKLTIGDVTSSKFTTYDSLSKVFSLYAALNPQPQLMEFGFVLRWPTLKPEQKRELYSKYASHELNFFLFKKDPEFFATVIRPYLKNKHSKTFMDHWLLGDDLSTFRAAWSYEQLNAVERILLSQRIADDAKFARQLIGEQVAVLPPNLERVEHLYRSAVASNSLDADDDISARFGDETSVVGGISRDGTLFYARSAKLGRGAMGGGGGFAAGAAPAAPPAAAAPGLANRERQLAEQDRAASFGKKGAAMDESRKSLEAKDAKADGKESGLRARRQLSNESLEKAKQYRGDDKANAKGERAEMESIELSDLETNGRADLQRRANARQLYRKLEATMEWAENNYYRLPIEQQNGGLVTSNAFWKDYADSLPVQNPNVDAAKNPGPPPFFSKHIAEASRNFTEMMFALAVLDLPFEAKEHKTTFDGVKMELAAGSSTVIFHQEVKAADFDANAPRTVLVNQNFFRNGDRHRTVNGEQVDKYVSDEFLTHVVYGCQVVVTNPTSTRQKLSVLVQVPQGAVPVANSHYTRSLPLDLQPYQTQTIEFQFYFPTTGEFSHYPVHVAKNEAIIAAATAKRLKVVDIPTSVDKQSWDYISQHGSNEDVLSFLATQNVLQINLEKMAFRLHDPAFFTQTIDLLSKRHIYHHALWSYAVKHNDAAAMRAYLLHADGFLNECGRAFDSPLVTVDPVERKQYQHLDYTPLVNARAHQLGKRRRILNDALYQQYHRLLAILASRPRLDDSDRMAVTYYLLLQDRVEEAQVFFSGVNAERLESKLQHDYFAAYFDLYSAEPDRAKAIVAKYRDFPVERWKTAFAGIASQLEEAGIKPLAGAIGPNAVASVDPAAGLSPLAPVLRGEGPGVRGSASTATSEEAPHPDPLPGVPGRGSKTVAAQQGEEVAVLTNDKGPMTNDSRPNDSATASNTALAATEPSFDFAVESKKVKLKFQNLKTVRVNYYEMDIELLFSRNPFVQQFSGEFSFIRPNETAELKLPEGKPDIEFDLPARFHNSNVLVEITAAGETKRQTYYSHALNVQTIENYGQVSVTHEKSKKPLAKTYVKVYARLGDGQVKFYKDGYTDLRGRFDYASINTGELDNVQRFSILILSEVHGAIVREATPPKR